MLAIPVYWFVCILGFKLYVQVANCIGQQIRTRAIRTMLLYIWFLGFVFCEVPFAFFFPAWLSESLEVFSPQPLTTGLLIMFGAVTFAFSGWYAWRGETARESATMHRQEQCTTD